jgi:hypothetical protein
MELEQLPQGVLGSHGQVDEDVPFAAVVQEGGLNLEEIQMILDEKVTSGFCCFGFQSLEQSDQFGGIEIVHCQPLVHGCLNGMSHSAKSTSKLVLKPGETGVK